MAIIRRKRLQDGSFGELEKVFKGETQDEIIKRFENEKEQLETVLLEISTINAIQQAQNEQAIMELTMMMTGGM